ncbi:hypothetical protein [uncultured Polaribacter sp.]|uniref:hypothetical protein n=1 Tax=uncultured Polaribacter sp. TaxID=174711 RepID=UPI00259B39E4|nr:hypothetical protein [uncultured Polaribacter sp.]
MIKIFLVIIFTFLSFLAVSQDYNLSNLKGNELNNSIRLNYILINQPNKTYSNGYTIKPKMGLMGINYNIPLTDWLYTGGGFHGAVYGDQGGLFTLGINLGVNTKIYKNIHFDANVHFGGGGGFRSLVGGGGIIYPSAGLQYKTNGYSFGVQYGYVNFFTKIQRGDNFSFFVEIPTTLRKTSYKNSLKEFTVNDKVSDKFWIKPAVKSVQMVTFDFLFPRGSTRNDGNGDFTNTTPITQTLSLLGFEYQKYITDNTFIYAHVDAMYKGLVAGFMDVFIGAGKNFIETKYINFYGKFGIGAAGGRIFPENGLTIYPSAGFDLKLSEQMGLSAHGGYHRAVGGTFEAYTTGISLKYYGLSGGIKDPFTQEKAKVIKTQGLQIGFQNQTYFNVAKSNNNPSSDLQLIALKINYDLNQRFYLSGETSFAYLGKSGGYAHGILGLGIRSNKFMNQKFSTFLELSAGVAGGGKVDSGEGILIRPTAGINYHLNDELSLHISGGQMWSPFGNVNSSNINIGLNYGLSILKAKK